MLSLLRSPAVALLQPEMRTTDHTDSTDEEEHARLPSLFHVSREEHFVGDMRGPRGQTWLFIRVIRVIRGLVRYPG